MAAFRLMIIPLYVLGEKFDVYGAVEGTQKIYQLNSSQDLTSINSLPATLNNFDGYPSSGSGIQGGTNYSSIIGLYPWTGGAMMTVKTQSGYTDTGGSIIQMKSWSIVGSPDTDPAYHYLVPLGILPNNKFYIVNESISVAKSVLRMDSPDDTDPDLKVFMSNPSSQNQSMPYYFEPSGLTY